MPSAFGVQSTACITLLCFAISNFSKTRYHRCVRACVCVGVPFAVGIPSDTITAPILFDTGASSNFVSPKFLKQAAVSYSSATLRLADDSSAPILGKVRVRLKLQSFVCTVTLLLD